MREYSFADLKERVCAITGGGGVIGKTLAKGLASVGIKVAVLDIKKDLADQAASELVKQYNIQAIGVGANVLDEDSLSKAKEIINNTLGPLDLLINCAGGNSPKATTDVEMMDIASKKTLEKTFYGLTSEGFRKVFDLNFMGTLLPSMILSKDMLDKGKGVILNISSMASFRPLTKVGAYSAAKASVNNFTYWLATHFAKLNIRVNAIAPGFFLTQQNRFLLIDEKTGKRTSRGQKIIDATPMGRYGEPEELCGTTLYLISDISSFVTGIVLPVDGGFNIYSGV